MTETPKPPRFSVYLFPGIWIKYFIQEDGVKSHHDALREVVSRFDITCPLSDLPGQFNDAEDLDEAVVVLVNEDGTDLEAGLRYYAIGDDWKTPETQEAALRLRLQQVIGEFPKFDVEIKVTPKDDLPQPSPA